VTATDPTANGEAPPVDPLEMARRSARNLIVYAEAQERDPLASHLHHYGERGFAAAQLGACMAAISAAEDIRRAANAIEDMAAGVRVIADRLTGMSEGLT
jgi:hypothetical protein